MSSKYDGRLLMSAEQATQCDHQMPNIQPRESFIVQAVSFLQTPSVQRSSLQQKQKFLRSKGLTEDEIQIACDRAAIFNSHTNSTIINVAASTNQPVMHRSLVANQPIKMQKLKDLFSLFSLFSGMTYAVYLFYKKFIKKFLYGKKKTIEESIEAIDQKLDSEIKNVTFELNRIRQDIIGNIPNETLSCELKILKTDLEAIKGLLLNRKQFSSPLPLVPPSIPAWQLTSHRHADTEPDKNDDTGSGSGSSETEVVTKNSDSSMELI